MEDAESAPMAEQERKQASSFSLKEKYGRNFFDSYNHSGIYYKHTLDEMGAAPFKEKLKDVLGKDATAARYVEWFDDDTGKAEWRYVLYGKKEDGKLVDDKSAIRVVQWDDEKKDWVEDTLGEETEEVSAYPKEMGGFTAENEDEERKFKRLLDLDDELQEKEESGKSIGSSDVEKYNTALTRVYTVKLDRERKNQPSEDKKARYKELLSSRLDAYDKFEKARNRGDWDEALKKLREIRDHYKEMYQILEDGESIYAHKRETAEPPSPPPDEEADQADLDEQEESADEAETQSQGAEDTTEEDKETHLDEEVHSQLFEITTKDGKRLRYRYTFNPDTNELKGEVVGEAEESQIGLGFTSTMSPDDRDWRDEIKKRNDELVEQGIIKGMVEMIERDDEEAQTRTTGEQINEEELQDLGWARIEEIPTDIEELRALNERMEEVLPVTQDMREKGGVYQAYWQWGRRIHDTEFDLEKVDTEAGKKILKENYRDRVRNRLNKFRKILKQEGRWAEKAASDKPEEEQEWVPPTSDDQDRAREMEKVRQKVEADEEEVENVVETESQAEKFSKAVIRKNVHGKLPNGASINGENIDETKVAGFYDHGPDKLTPSPDKSFYEFYSSMYTLQNKLPQLIGLQMVSVGSSKENPENMILTLNFFQDRKQIDSRGWFTPAWVTVEMSAESGEEFLEEIKKYPDLLESFYQSTFEGLDEIEDQPGMRRAKSEGFYIIQGDKLAQAGNIPQNVASIEDYFSDLEIYKYQQGPYGTGDAFQPR